MRSGWQETSDVVTPSRRGYGKFCRNGERNDYDASLRMTRAWFNVCPFLVHEVASPYETFVGCAGFQAEGQGRRWHRGPLVVSPFPLTVIQDRKRKRKFRRKSLRNQIGQPNFDRGVSLNAVRSWSMELYNVTQSSNEIQSRHSNPPV